MLTPNLVREREAEKTFQQIVRFTTFQMRFYQITLVWSQSCHASSPKIKSHLCTYVSIASGFLAEAVGANKQQFLWHGRKELNDVFGATRAVQLKLDGLSNFWNF